MRREPLGKIPLRQISRCHGDKRLRSIGLAGCHTQIYSCTVQEQIPTLLQIADPRETTMLRERLMLHCFNHRL